MTLETATDNLTAQRLYESLGWVRDPGYYTYCLDLKKDCPSDPVSQTPAA
jgi:ribosomal protein S18 acetylase RimI-like enzyme